MNIINLQEISPNSWKAKYRGNYGIYTIKIKTDGKETVDYSCSCPSDYYPCKHISMIEEAIKERITKSQKSDNEDGIRFDKLLRELSQKELRDFIIRQTQHNPQLKNTVLLEFAHKIKKTDVNAINNYNQLLRNALDGLHFDYDDIEYNYEYDCIEIDILDQWLDKAKKHVKQKNWEEATFICKACIEEYATWINNYDSDIVEYFDTCYQEIPFDILTQTLSVQGTDFKSLFDYCKSEMLKPKYKGTEMYDGFNGLFMELSALVGSDDFVLLQDKLLQEIEDKSSYDVQIILQRKIDYYRNNKQPEKAWDVIRENLQIESFRKELVKKLISENKLQEAKKLINDYISHKGNENRGLYQWHILQLQIAQKENNIPEIRRISFLFIESGFQAEYYNKYKSTFTKEEWAERVEKLIQHYEKRHKTNWFNSSVADVLQAEKQEERLMNYVEKHLSIDILEKYHTAFSASFPEKTLALFRQTIDQYAQNTGREIYERIVKLLGKMVKIRGGNDIVKEMINQYKILYKNRKAMMEIINRFKI